MEHKVFSIYDSKTETYSKPFYMKTIGEATRAFGDLANNKDTDVGRHPEDYTLFNLGVFEDTTAVYTPLEAKTPLGTANEHLSIL
jgi:hypothetical protein